MPQHSPRKRLVFLIPALMILLTAGILLGKHFFLPARNDHYHSTLLENIQQAEDFDSFTDALFCYEVTADSITTAYTLKEPGRYHIPDLAPSLSNFSHDAYKSERQRKARQDLLSSLSQKLGEFDCHSLTENDRLTHQLLQKNFDLSQKMENYAYYEELLGSQSGVQANLPITLSEYPLRSEKDVKTYLTLLTQIPNYFENIIGYEKQRTALGYSTPAFALNETRDSLSRIIKSMEEGSDCFTETFSLRIQKLPGLSKRKKAAYGEQNKKYVQKYVLPAYKNLDRYIGECLTKSEETVTRSTADSSTTDSGAASQDNASTTGIQESSSRNRDYIPDSDTAYGLASLPKGKEYYALLVAKNTGSAKSVEALIAKTEQSLKETLGSVLQTALTDQESYFYYIDHPLESYYQSPEAILDALSLMCRESYPALTKNPTYEIKTVPNSLQECSSPAFYMIPAIDDFEGNTIYINPIYTNTENGNLFTTLAHEGFPGHLYQTVYYNSTSPSPLRQMLDYPGYVEGWATYVEMDSFSYLDYGNKASLCKLYQADTLINLALCSRVDLGVNYEGWTLNDVNAFFNENGFKSYYGADLYSYVVQSPAVYLRYFIGYLEIMELKDEYQRLKMENYSEKEFHKAFLEIGPADFETIRQEMLGTGKK